MSFSPQESPWAIPVISAIIERDGADGPEILVQTRIAAYDTVYSGSLEIPAGKIDSFENVYDTVVREVKEETGLDITEITPPRSSRTFETSRNDAAMVFQPYCCQQLTKGSISWIGFVFLCKAKGELRAADGETKDVRWMNIKELKTLIETSPDKIFTLQLPVLDFYIRQKLSS